MDVLGECFWTARDLRPMTVVELGEHLRSVVLLGSVSMDDMRRASGFKPTVSATTIPLGRPAPKLVPLWRVVASTVLIEVLACTAAILFYLAFYAKIAG